MRHARSMRLAAGLIVFLSSGAWGGDEPGPRPPDDGETVGKYKDYLSRLVAGPVPTLQTQVAVDVKKEVAEKTTIVSPPEGFADRVSDGLADFLPLFQGAINAVSTSEDRKSLTVKFNALRTHHGDLALSAVVTEPQVFKPLEDAIVEPARPNQNKVLLGKTRDFSDLTFPVTFGFRRESGSWDNPKTPILWGRETSNYRILVDRLLELAWEQVLPSTGAALDAAKTRLGQLESVMKTFFEQNPTPGVRVRPFLAVDDVTFADIKRALPDRWPQYVEALQADARAKQALVQDLGSSKMVDRIAALIDNQPQLTFTGSYQKRGEFVGPNAYALSLNFEAGHRNFNSVIRRTRWMKDNEPDGDARTRPLRAFLDVVNDETNDIRKEDKLVMSLTYKRTRPFALTYDYNETVTDLTTLAEVLVPHTAALDLPASHETTGKVQWGRTLRGRKAFETLLLAGTATHSLPSTEGPHGKSEGAKPRFDVSLEYLDVTGDPQRQNRFVARGTLTLPLQSGLSLPLTISYANHSEFLGDPDEQLSAHVGLSYKFNKAP